MRRSKCSTEVLCEWGEAKIVITRQKKASLADQRCQTALCGIRFSMASSKDVKISDKALVGARCEGARAKPQRDLGSCPVSRNGNEGKNGEWAGCLAFSTDPNSQQNFHTHPGIVRVQPDAWRASPRIGKESILLWSTTAWSRSVLYPQLSPRQVETTAIIPLHHIVSVGRCRAPVHAQSREVSQRKVRRDWRLVHATAVATSTAQLRGFKSLSSFAPLSIRASLCSDTLKLISLALFSHIYTLLCPVDLAFGIVTSSCDRAQASPELACYFPSFELPVPHFFTHVPARPRLTIRISQLCYH